MPSSPSSTSPDPLQSILSAARPFLRDELERVDPNLPSLVAVLRSVGAGECWHKHGSFLDHLVDIYRILKLWSAPDVVALCGLFHSAYSNSYVNLAIFDPSTSRDLVRSHVGAPAERLIHLFCVVPRHPLIHDHLLFRYSDADLSHHLLVSSSPSPPSAPWRQKLNSILPPDGVVVKHIKTGEDVRLSRRVVASFLLLTMADFSDQIFGFQDLLFDNSDGRLEFSGNNSAWALWPGDGKPGLWLNSMSRMGALYHLIAREEQMFIEERNKALNTASTSDVVVDESRDEGIELVIPPVFEGCTKILGAEEQIAATELYWEAVCDGGRGGLQKAQDLLEKCLEKNPYVGEPHIVLAQAYLCEGRYGEAERVAEKGLTQILSWGSPWDKRMSWEGWVAWARVLLMKAKERSWPKTGWGVLNLGLVS